MARTIPEHLSLDHRLASELTEGKLGFAYQPIIALPDGAVVGVEALARLTTPDLIDLRPDVFLPQLFRLGLAQEVTEATLRTGLSDLEVLAKQFDAPGLTLSLNISAPQLRAADGLHRMVDSALTETGIDPQRVTLEIVEDLAAPQRSLAAAPLEALRGLGVRVALDDFGTGRSSLEHLLDLEVDEIKIDRGFVTGLADNPKKRAGVAALIGLARDLELSVVAEGVDSPSDLAEVAALGCSRVQGWAVGRPMRVEQRTSPIERHSPVSQGAATEADRLVADLEQRLLDGVRVTSTEAATALAQLPSTSGDDPQKARVGRVRSWLVHVADEGSGAVTDHTIAANRTLETGDVGRAAAEFSRAAVGAGHTNDLITAQRSIARCCALLADDGCAPEERFRAVYNLTWMFADVTRHPAGAELLARLLSAADGRLSDQLLWNTGHSSAVLAVEMLERQMTAPDLVSAHPDRLFPALTAIRERLGHDAPAVSRAPLTPLLARWLLVSGHPPADVRALLEAQEEPRIEAVSDAYWDVARSELLAAEGQVDAAIERNERATEVFGISGFYYARILHSLHRKATILSDRARHREADETRVVLLARIEADRRDALVQVFGGMLDFDLQSVLASEIAKLSSRAP